VGGLERLVGELLLERHLLAALLLQAPLQVLEVELVAEEQRQREQQHGGARLHRRRPGTQVVEIQLGQVDLAQPLEGLGQAHGSTPFSSRAAGTTCCTASWKTLA